MNKKLILRKAHRYIGLLISIQLLAWTIGGIYFSWNDLDKIHGDHLKTTAVQTRNHLIDVKRAITAINDLDSISSINVIDMLGKPVYRIKYNTKDQVNNTQLVNALDGQLMGEINQQQAIEIARFHANFEADVAKAELITSTDPHHEYREKILPAWAITFEHPDHPTFYVSPIQGELISVRHSSWRIFDFLWMLHTMDYQTRDDFGNWLIKIFSIIALITALSGIVLFIISSRKFNKRKS